MLGTLSQARQIYVLTRKKHDLLFNYYVMRPIAAVVVAAIAKTGVTPNQITLLGLAIFVVSAFAMVALPTFEGGLVALAILEASYCLDCVDGMLARYKKIASKTGHLFDFFVDEIKALILVGVLGLRLYRAGGFGLGVAAGASMPVTWPAGHVGFLLAAIAGIFVVASATSLTNFVRRPEVSGKESGVEAHYETEVQAKPKSLVGKVAALVMTFLRFLNHYPSHLWIFAALGRLDVFFWMYIALNSLYLARGWLGLVVRFGRDRDRTVEK